MMTDHHPQQLSFDFDGAEDCNNKIAKNEINKKFARSAAVIHFSDFLQERKRSETVQLYEKIFDSIKHIG